MKIFSNKLLLYFSVVPLLFISVNNAQDWRKIESLKGAWKFTIGDDKQWSETYYNDSSWEKVRVPSAWEDEGFHGYNGFAWYRKKFEFRDQNKYENIYLDLGYIDDVDQVYFNGKMIGGSGTFPPDYKTAYNAYRRYFVPKDYFNSNGWNVIAVRIYDAELSGGIISGGIGLYTPDPKTTIDIALHLEGIWRFKTGDNLDWAKPDLTDSGWQDIGVPMKWEYQGFENYDGFAWYRKSFNLPQNLASKNLVLVLGKIDDIDQVYFNGHLIGSTGDFLITPTIHNVTDEYFQFRGYYIPSNLINKNGNNVLAVRVYDDYLDGGIYEGPIGITTKDKYIEFWKEQKKNPAKKSIWDIFFD